MTLIHTHHWHLPRGPNIYVLALGGLGASLLALIFFVVAWMTAGYAYVHEFGGMVTLSVILITMTGFAGLGFFERP